jgi:hypothetical protein
LYAVSLPITAPPNQSHSFVADVAAILLSNFDSAESSSSTTVGDLRAALLFVTDKKFLML